MAMFSKMICHNPPPHFKSQILASCEINIIFFSITVSNAGLLFTADQVVSFINHWLRRAQTGRVLFPSAGAEAKTIFKCQDVNYLLTKDN